MNESPKAAAAYAEYEAMGPERSLRKLADRLQPDAAKRPSKVRQLQEWSSTFGWVERAKAFDAEQVAERRRKQAEAVAAMNERHAQIGTSQQAQALKQIQALIAAQKFGSQAAVQLLKLATDLERLSRGAATSIEEQQHTGGIGVAQITLDQLAALQHLATADTQAWEQERGYHDDDLAAH